MEVVMALSLHMCFFCFAWFMFISRGIMSSQYGGEIYWKTKGHGKKPSEEPLRLLNEPVDGQTEQVSWLLSVVGLSLPKMVDRSHALMGV